MASVGVILILAYVTMLVLSAAALAGSWTLTLRAACDAEQSTARRGMNHARSHMGLPQAEPLVLSAAALTYVAAALTSVLTLLYFLMRLGVFGGSRRDD